MPSGVRFPANPTISYVFSTRAVTIAMTAASSPGVQLPSRSFPPHHIDPDTSSARSSRLFVGSTFPKEA